MMLVVLDPQSGPRVFPVCAHSPNLGMLSGSGSGGGVGEWVGKSGGMAVNHLSTNLRPAHLLQGHPLNYAPQQTRPKTERRNGGRSLPPTPSDQIDDRKKHNNARYKTELCRPFLENGTCKYAEKCQFAHGETELRLVPRHPKYKTEKCKTFHSTGFCPYGPRCHFIHNACDEAVGLGSGAPSPRPPRPRPLLGPLTSPSALSRAVPPMAPTDLILDLANQRQRQLSVQALSSGGGCSTSLGSSCSAGSASPRSFSSSEEDAALLLASPPAVSALSTASLSPEPTDALAADLAALFPFPASPPHRNNPAPASPQHQAAASQRLAVFRRFSSAAA